MITENHSGLMSILPYFLGRVHIIPVDIFFVVVAATNLIVCAFAILRQCTFHTFDANK